MLALLVCALPLLTGAPGRVAVVELAADGGADPVIGKQLTGRLAEVVGRRGLSVIAPDDVRALLEQEAKKQLIGCADDQCLMELAGALGVETLLSGRVSRIEGGYAISLSLVDARRAQALAHAQEQWRGESIALLELAEPMVDRLLDPRAELTGSLEVTGAEDGSRVLVDDQLRGTAPTGQMGRIPIGAHKLLVASEDHAPEERWIVVKRDQLTTVAVTQRRLEAPLYARWWFWTGAAVVVAGGAVAAGLLFGGAAPGGATGINVSASADRAFEGR